jgi:DNA invertase Pin-like site-specific DNA recombinase
MEYALKPIAVGYLRVSTEDQGRSGLGLEDQERGVRAYCEQRGIELDKLFIELESGRRNDRPELRKALARARKVKGELVVSTLSRLGRRVAFISGLMETGTPFRCADAPSDEPFILHLKAGFAEEEARKISQRTKAAAASKRLRGEKLGKVENLSDVGRRKGAESTRSRALEAHAAVEPLIMRLRAKGLSYASIAERLNDENRTSRDGATPYTAMTVMRIVKRAALRDD